MPKHAKDYLLYEECEKGNSWSCNYEVHVSESTGRYVR